MSLLRRLVLGLATCFGAGCGARTYHEQQLLDPCLTDGTTLTVFVGVERGTRTVSGGSFNPNGPRTTSSVVQADLYRAEFSLTGTTATWTRGEHLLRITERPLASAITAGDGFLTQNPPPATDDAETQRFAPQGNRFCVRRDRQYTIYADSTRTVVVDSGTVPALDTLHFTWSGEVLYLISCDMEGRRSRIHSTQVGSNGVWEELLYDAEASPIDADAGATFVEAFDRLDGKPVLLLRKSYKQQGGMASYRPPTYALILDQRLVSTWTGDPPGWIRPDLRAVVDWHRSSGSLKGTLSFRSLDDGQLRSIAVDANRAVTLPDR